MQVALFRITLGAERRKFWSHREVPKETITDREKVPMDKNLVSTLILMMDNAVEGETNDTYELHVLLHRMKEDAESFDDF